MTETEMMRNGGVGWVVWVVWCSSWIVDSVLFSGEWRELVEMFGQITFSYPELWILTNSYPILQFHIPMGYEFISGSALLSL